MSHNRRIGNAAEAFFAGELQKLFPDHVILPLQQDCAADLVRLFPGGWCLHEVKSSKIRRRALSAPLTAREKVMLEGMGPLMYKVGRVLRIPATPKDHFEVLRWA